MSPVRPPSLASSSLNFSAVNSRQSVASQLGNSTQHSYGARSNEHTATYKLSHLQSHGLQSNVVPIRVTMQCGFLPFSAIRMRLTSAQGDDHGGTGRREANQLCASGEFVRLESGSGADERCRERTSSFASSETLLDGGTLRTGDLPARSFVPAGFLIASLLGILVRYLQHDTLEKAVAKPLTASLKR